MATNGNMSKSFIDYNTAKALKELGFDEPCIGSYNDKGNFNIGSTFGITNSLIDEWIRNGVIGNYICTAPTHQQVIDWLYDKHGLHVSIFPISKNQWVYEISFIETYPENYKDGHFYGNVDTQQVIDELLFKDNRGIKLPSLDEMAANNYGRYAALNAAIDEAIKSVKK